MVIQLIAFSSSFQVKTASVQVRKPYRQDLSPLGLQSGVVIQLIAFSSSFQVKTASVQVRKPYRQDLSPLGLQSGVVIQLIAFSSSFQVEDSLSTSQDTLQTRPISPGIASFSLLHSKSWEEENIIKVLLP